MYAANVAFSRLLFVLGSVLQDPGKFHVVEHPVLENKKKIILI
jgi:hypothetical protein